MKGDEGEGEGERKREKKRGGEEEGRPDDTELHSLSLWKYCKIVSLCIFMQ